MAFYNSAFESGYKTQTADGLSQTTLRLNYNIIEDPHRYAVQWSDTTMMPIAASLPVQKAVVLNKLQL